VNHFGRGLECIALLYDFFNFVNIPRHHVTFVTVFRVFIFSQRFSPDCHENLLQDHRSSIANVLVVGATVLHFFYSSLSRWVIVGCCNGSRHKIG